MSEVLQVKALPHRSDAFARLTELLGQTPAETTRLLWDTYHPSQVWTPFALAGLAGRPGPVYLQSLCQTLAGDQRLMAPLPPAGVITGATALRQESAALSH